MAETEWVHRPLLALAADLCVARRSRDPSLDQFQTGGWITFRPARSMEEPVSRGIWFPRGFARGKGA